MVTPSVTNPTKEIAARLYNGLAQLVVQSKPSSGGTITVSATAEGLTPASTTIQLRSAVAPLSLGVPTDRSMTLRRWRMSPPSDARPEPTLQPGATDMNTWTSVEAGRVQTLTGGKFALLRTTVTPRQNIQARGGTFVLEKLRRCRDRLHRRPTRRRKERRGFRNTSRALPAGQW